MQNSFHCRKVILCIGLLAGISEATPGFSGPSQNPADSLKASDLHLIPGGGMSQDLYHVGIEITLKPGALTYWRQPGDAGVPPIFSFDGSENLASAQVFYPAPIRIREDEGEAFGYHDKVVFPLHVAPRDKALPIAVKLTAYYAVCERICIPAKSHVEIDLPVHADAQQDAAVAAAEARVPQHLSQGEAAAKVTLTPQTKDGHPSWLFDWKDKSAVTDLFVEAPDSWYFETKKTTRDNQFEIVAVQTPKTTEISTVPLTLTVTGPQQNFEFAVSLDAPASP